MIFNGPILNASMSLHHGRENVARLTTLTSNVEGGNVGKFFGAITGSGDAVRTPYFAARREEVITSQHYFVEFQTKSLTLVQIPHLLRLLMVRLHNQHSLKIQKHL